MKWVTPSPTPQCSSYWKESFWIALDYGCQLYFIYILSFTDRLSLYHNSSVSLDTYASSWDQNPPNFTLDLVSYRSASWWAFICFYIFALLDTRVLILLEELCITWLAAINFCTKVLNPQEGSIYIVIHRQTVLLYHNSSVWLDT